MYKDYLKPYYTLQALRELLAKYISTITLII